MEMLTTGVSLGRFNPVIHRGHQRTIDQMLADNGPENSLIMIGSANKVEDRNPLSFPQRRHLAQKLYPDVEIVPLLDVAKDQSDFWQTLTEWQEGLLEQQAARETRFKFYGGSPEDLSYMQPDFETYIVDRSQLLVSGTQLRQALEANDLRGASEMIDERIYDLMLAYYRFQVAQIVNPVSEFGPFHINARLTTPPGYPERVNVPEDQVFWELDFPEYTPADYTAPSVLANDETFETGNKWAHPQDWTQADIPNESLLGIVMRDELGRPLNPLGRTGIMGRGLLGKWGPNLAVDPVITRNNPETGVLELLIIQRRSGAWGFPGGFVEKGDTVEKTLSKELLEETALDLDLTQAERIYEGYVDSSRNTDNAWVETVAAHKHLSALQAQELVPVAGDDAQDVAWLNLESDDWSKALVDTHAQIINAFLQNLNT